MKFDFIYYPIQFFLIAILGSLVLGFIAAYLSYREQSGKMQVFLISSLFLPLITTLIMIFFSDSKEMIQDFWTRLFLFKIQSSYLAVILLLVPCVFFLATAISLPFGYSTEQFSLSKEFSVMRGWGILGVFVPFLLAPLIEELAWRGYGVDSLISHFNLFTCSLVFASLWALWHLPLFFVKGYYQNQLWDLGIIYVVNFFASVFVVAFLMNWVYYQTGRSIPAVILFHSVLNISAILFRTEAFTKCIVTLLLCLVLIFIVAKNQSLFFGKSMKAGTQISKTTQTLNHRLKTELDLLQNQYAFPGATMAYVLSNGESGTVATGLADIEKGEAMTNESRMLAASIGKTFVATTIIALSKEGILGLDDPLSKWLGDNIYCSRVANFETITLRDLLRHTAGIADHTATEDFVELLSQRDLQCNNSISPESLVRYILDHPPLFEAGKGWRYTDTGYILLGLVIEAATGSSYYDELDRLFLKPLNLCQTAPSDRLELQHLAAGYTSENKFFGPEGKTVDNEGVMLWNPGFEWTGGGLISNSSDLATWAKLLYEGKAMPGEYLDDLLQAVPTGSDESTTYGLGVTIEDKTPFGLRFGHGGVIPGYTSSMRYYSQHGVALAFQINTDTGISDQSSELVNDMEKRLAGIVIHQ
jgi:CubicO group peptidase (beta-lactamase class C family)/membrane protease YdiL (CAAX protease family)